VALAMAGRKRRMAGRRLRVLSFGPDFTGFSVVLGPPFWTWCALRISWSLCLSFELGFTVYHGGRGFVLWLHTLFLFFFFFF
jgi:hypothetical protein